MRLISPAPGGWPNLAFGNTTVSPYSPSRPHGGRDWGYYYASAASRRTVAPAGGTIIAAHSDGGNHNGWGNYVDILIPSNGHRIVSRLAHHASISVRTGDRVAQGADIGVMGATGETYGQTHLHEELWIDGDRVDPDYYRTFDLPGTTASPTGGGGTPLEDDMPLDANADYEAFKTMLQRALKFDVRPNGAGADARLGRTLWEQLNGIENAASTPVTAEQVKVIADAVVAAIGQPTAAVDYALIAKTVNDEAARRLAS